MIVTEVADHYDQRRPEPGPEWLMAMGTAGGRKRERLSIRARWIHCSSLGILGAHL